MLEQIANNTYRPFLAYSDRLERFVYLLLFLFPIAGMSVRHWISNIFILLMLIGLFTLRRTSEPLMREEKFFLWVCAAFFASFVLSALVNGWEYPQTRAMGTELRFLAVIPIYLLVRRYNDCTKWLLRGAIVGGFFLLGQAIYDVSVLKLGHANGVYSKNIIGPLSVVVAFWSFYYAWLNWRTLTPTIYIIIIVSIVCALIAAGMSSSRGGYVGFLLTSLFSVFLFFRPRWIIVGLIGITIVTVLLYNNISNVHNRVDRAYSGIVSYYKSEDTVKDLGSDPSVGIRLEMWRASVMMFKENIIFGVGPENYRTHALNYIELKLINPEVGLHENPHNAFLEALNSKGTIGYILFLLLLYYPAYVYIRDYKTYKSSAVIGLIHIVLITSFSLTDHSVIVKNNYVSILLLGMAVFYSSHLRSILKEKPSHG